MKNGLKCLICAASGLAWMAANAVPVEDGGDSIPYHAIVTRNVFNVHEPPPPEPPKTPEPPAVKITLTGISTLMGTKMALLKTPPSAPKPGEKAVEHSYMLREGEREDGIQILQIDEKAGSVKVDNSGNQVTLTFEKDGQKPSTGSAPPPAAGFVPPHPGNNPAPVNPAAGTASPAPSFGRPMRSNLGVSQSGNPQAGYPGQPGYGGQAVTAGGQTLNFGAANYAGGQNTGFSAAAARTTEENVLLYETARANSQNIPGRPAMPLHPLLKNPNPGVDPADLPPQQPVGGP